MKKTLLQYVKKTYTINDKTIVWIKKEEDLDEFISKLDSTNVIIILPNNKVINTFK